MVAIPAAVGSARNAVEPLNPQSPDAQVFNDNLTERNIPPVASFAFGGGYRPSRRNPRGQHPIRRGANADGDGNDPPDHPRGSGDDRLAFMTQPSPLARRDLKGSAGGIAERLSSEWRRHG
jgi:hypothetical protein